MYFLFGSKDILKNVALVSRSHLDLTKPVGIDELREGLRCHLRATQTGITANESSSGAGFVDCLQTEKALLSLYIPKEPDEIDKQVNGGSIAEGMLRYDVDRKRSVIKTMEEASLRLREKDPIWYELFQLIINRVFWFPIQGRGGGTTSAGLGVIWANPPRSWQEIDLLELLIHEFTHNLVFLDERVHMHYPSYKELDSLDHFAISAILRIPRRLDRVLHSLVVGSEILLARENLIGHDFHPIAHPRSNDLIAQNLETIDSIKKIPRWESLLTERAQIILQRCEETNLSLSRSLSA